MKSLKKSFPLPEIADNAILTIRTSGEKGIIDRRAHVARVEDRSGYQMESFFVFEDFSRRIFPPLKQRVTDKALEAAHAEALGIVDQIKAAAIAHYKND